MDRPAPALKDTQLIRLIQSCGDFQQALSALTFLLDECDYTVNYSVVELRRFQCYENSAIVAFARPFEVSRGRTALSLRAVGVRFDADEELLKNKIIELRRKVVAHSDEERMHFKIYTTQPFEDSPVALPVLLFQESLRLESTETKELVALLRKLIRALSETIFDIAQLQPASLNVYKKPSN